MIIGWYAAMIVIYFLIAAFLTSAWFITALQGLGLMLFSALFAYFGKSVIIGLATAPLTLWLLMRAGLAPWIAAALAGALSGLIGIGWLVWERRAARERRAGYSAIVRAYDASRAAAAARAKRGRGAKVPAETPAEKAARVRAEEAKMKLHDERCMFGGC